MINPEFISDQLLFSTVRIEATLADGSKAVGTGFFFTFSFGERFVPSLITNRHVVPDNAVEWTIHLHEGVLTDGTNLSPSDQSFPVTIDHYEACWIHARQVIQPQGERSAVNRLAICHPAGLDLCALPIQPLLEKLEKQTGKHAFYRSLAADLIPSEQALEELTAIEDIIMIGYPIGLWDHTNNMPIVRAGITASHPALDFNGRPEGLVDAACFPGSSGSPILIFNVGTYFVRPNTLTTGSRALLIGVLYGGPQFTAEGNIVVRNIPMQAAPIPQLQLPINLGFYIKAREIRALGDEIKKLAAAADV
ncbi:MAG: S1 family peptidase [Phycisphaerae bacterium]